jgi:hypothetical protein
VRGMADVCGVSRSAYYAWAASDDEPAEAVLEEAHLANLAWDTYWASRGRYGSSRICAELWRQGSRPTTRTVEALMAALGLQGLSGPLVEQPQHGLSAHQPRARPAQQRPHSQQPAGCCPLVVPLRRPAPPRALRVYPAGPRHPDQAPRQGGGRLPGARGAGRAPCST